jgi:DHA2 family multidrug resistance protein-like MFS transporter
MHTASVTGAVLLAGAAAAAAVTLRRVRVRKNAGQADQLSPSGV